MLSTCLSCIFSSQVHAIRRLGTHQNHVVFLLALATSTTTTVIHPCAFYGTQAGAPRLVSAPATWLRRG